jgi:hypothetical protein
VESDHGPGPAEAVAEFLEGNDAFVRDESREKFLLTFNPGGYLQKRESAVGSAPGSSALHDRLRSRLRFGERASGWP